jgi:hypothetical protein
MQNKRIADPKFLPSEFVERRIYLVRGRKVMFDADLAELYQVSTKILNQAVKRNLDRFPFDFMFQLNKNELEDWRSQIMTSNPEAMRSQFVTASKRNMRYAPYAFTEQGVAMLSSVLNSKRAVQMNILIIRVFMKMRQLLLSNKELAERVEKLEASTKRHASALIILINDIRKLTDPPIEPGEEKEPMGFHMRE